MAKPREIIAILRGIMPDEAVAACSALIDAGITRIEVPLNSPGPFDSIERVSKALKGQGAFGAGTVLSVDDVRRVADSGGSFIVSPDTNAAVIVETRQLGLQSYPGVMTPSECFAALQAGATGLKFFPAGILGPAGIQAMKAVLPSEIPLYAVGGANPDNFAEYFAAGCSGFGLGTYLYKPGMTPEEISQRARVAVASYDRSLANVR